MHIAAALVLCVSMVLGAPLHAEVIRCADGEGRISYTDGACPAGARSMGRVDTRAPVSPVSPVSPALPMPTAPGASSAPGAPPAAPAATASVPPVAPAGRAVAPVPAGPIIIDGRGQPQRDEPAGGERWSTRGADPVLIDDGYAPYPVPRVYPPSPPRDMRPRLRRCDAAGCQDTQGNHYDRGGQLDRYRSLDGKTCRPVGTTTICR